MFRAVFLLTVLVSAGCAGGAREPARAKPKKPEVYQGDEKPKTETTFLFYISADAEGLYGEYDTYDHLRKIFDRRENPQALRYHSAFLFDPFGTEDAPVLEVYRNGELVVEKGEKYEAAVNERHSKIFWDSMRKKVPLDMGDPRTLRILLRTVHEAGLVSQQYVLIFIGHGNAWLGVSHDQDGGKRGFKKDQPRPTFLSTQEITEVLSDQLPLPNGKKRLDALVFNACLMGSLEVMVEFAPFAKRFMSSSLQVPIVGKDFDINGSAEVKAQYDYLRHNMKFDFLRKDEAHSANEILKALLESVVFYDERYDEQSFTHSTYSDDPVFHYFLEFGSQFRLESKSFEVSDANYYWTDLDEILALQSTFEKDLSRPLIKYIEEENPELFHPAVLYPDHSRLGSTLVALPKLLQFLIEDPRATRFLDPDKLESLLNQLRQRVHAFAPDRVRSFSIFLPSMDFVRQQASLGTILDEDTTFDDVLATQGLLKFNESFGWGKVIQEYLAAKQNRHDKGTNLPERDAFDDDAD